MKPAMCGQNYHVTCIIYDIRNINAVVLSILNKLNMHIGEFKRRPTDLIHIRKTGLKNGLKHILLK